MPCEKAMDIVFVFSRFISVLIILLTVDTELFVYFATVLGVAELGT